MCKSFPVQVNSNVYLNRIGVTYFPIIHTEVTFWLCHDFAPIHELTTGVDDVIEFLKNTQEIVLFDIDRFPNISVDGVGFSWNSDRHSKLKEYLISTFDPWLVKPGPTAWQTPLSDIWNREGLAQGQGRIIITYSDPESNPEFFFPHSLIGDGWGNKQTLVENYNYLNSKVSFQYGDYCV